MVRQRYGRRLVCCSRTPASLCLPCREPSRAHPRGKPGFSTYEGGFGREPDAPLEGEGFEPSVPRQKDNAFRDSSFPTCARATAAFENARRPVQHLLLLVVDRVRMNAELTPQLGDRPVPRTAATRGERQIAEEGGIP